MFLLVLAIHKNVVTDVEASRYVLGDLPAHGVLKNFTRRYLVPKFSLLYLYNPMCVENVVTSRLFSSSSS